MAKSKNTVTPTPTTTTTTTDTPPADWLVLGTCSGSIKGDGKLAYEYSMSEGEFVSCKRVRESTVTGANGKLHTILNTTNTDAKLGLPNSKAYVAFYTDGPHKGRPFFVRSFTGTNTEQMKERAKTASLQDECDASYAAAYTADPSMYPIGPVSVQNLAPGMGSTLGGYLAALAGRETVWVEAAKKVSKQAAIILELERNNAAKTVEVTDLKEIVLAMQADIAALRAAQAA